MVIARALSWVAVLVAVLAAGDPVRVVAPREGRVGAADRLFGSTRLHTFHLTVAAADFDRMRAAAPGGPYDEVPATLEFDDRAWDVSLRYKGNSSYRYAPSELKRSFKLRFASESGLFFGLSELNLNNNAFDPSQMRETLAYDVFRRAGVTAPRTAYSRVLLTVPGTHDRRYVGLYTVVEQIDEGFLVDRWRQKPGLLLKPDDRKGMPFLGGDWDRYEGPYGVRIAERADRARFVAFVKLLNQASDDEFAQRVGDYLDVDAFLRFLACEVVLVNTDSPLATGRNYWIAMHPLTGKMVWLPWDLNMAFAGFQPSDASLSVHAPTAPGAFPLADRVLANRDMRAKYVATLREIMASNFTVARLQRQMASIERSIGAAGSAEPSPIRSQAPPLREFVVERVREVNRQLKRVTQAS